MDSAVFTATSKDISLPLASLRLLVPPLQLMTASMWQVLKTQDVMSYWKVAEFVCFVMDLVPELLTHRHRTQLNLGLRARFILELCRKEFVEPELILSHMEKIKSQPPFKMEQNEEEEAADKFLELIQTLLKDAEEREDFFLEVFPAAYGAQYDRDLQTLFGEFLCRLAQLLPVPDLEQTVSWLIPECSVLEECVHSLSEPTDLKNLLQHHKNYGHLEQHVPPSSMGDSILSSLSAQPPSGLTTSAEQPNQLDSLQVLSVDAQTVSFVEDVAVEIITVTDYPEVELGASTEIEAAVAAESCSEELESSEADVQVALPEEATMEATREIVEVVCTDVIHPEAGKQASASPQPRGSVGPHDCPDCDKKFKFASSLIAHRVIHTGERPHRCSECGRCFSFRQSLDRHKHTHKTASRRDCAAGGEAFRSPPALAEPQRTHMEDGGHTCQECSRAFSSEPALSQHPTSHTDADRTTATNEDQQEVVERDDVSDAAVEPSRQPQVENDHLAGVGSGDGPSAEPGEDVISVVKVRTSGRKRKPTMKIQVINLQKRMASKRRKEPIIKASPPTSTCTEHSYGSPAVSSKDSEKVSEDSEEVQVQQHVSSDHCEEAEADEQWLQPPGEQGGRFGCSDCEKSFKFRSLLKAHQRIHTGEQPFLCSQCGRRFSFKQSLERHKQTHKPGRQYECLICGEFFKSLGAQRDHQSTHMENNEYLCTECGRAFAWKSALVRHLKTHGESPDRVERPFRCPRCEQSFGCASYLSRHLQTHQEKREHSCNCGKSFAYRSALTAHQRIHQKERPHACAQCGKGFLYKGGLLSHMKIHSEEMPFTCSYCGKSFKRERNMKKHERCHTRENVFSCSQCDKSFVYKATLTRHELTHSGERPFLCSDCGKGFFSHAELLKHERFHTGHKPFQCPHCGKTFTQSCYLTVHLRYHTGARPYACGECGKSFLSANRLKRHQRTHSGERPYLCGECGKGFRQSYNLKMHQRTHVM